MSLQRLSKQQYAARPHRFQPQQRLSQRSLSVPRHPSYSQDFALTNAEADVLKSTLSGPAFRGHVPELQPGLADLVPGVDVEMRFDGVLIPKHRRHQALGVEVATGCGGYHLPPPQHGNIVGDRQGFSHLVSK